MSNLLVYSASAGSGKTHSIAGQYIMMLFSKKQAHRNILAITFTNKACEEMKVRIVEEMHKVASNHPDSRIDEIAAFTKLPKASILNQAKHIFKDILHDYSFFSVSTIDSFFQKIVRNFTRETGIQYNYEIELDKESIVNQAVDDMLELSTNDKSLKKNIINLVQQNIDNSKKWDFRKDLKSFIKNVIESDYRMYEEAYNEFFSSKEQKTAFLKELNTIEKSFLNQIESYCIEMKDIMLKHGVELGAFSGGAGRSIPSRLLKTHDKTKDSALDIDAHFNNYDTIEKWLKKADLEKEPLKTCTLQLISTTEKLKEYYLK
jgi:ATP-dependent exoDNAse (exonuclease V) beta subunit